MIAGHKNVDVRNIHWIEPDAVFDKSFGSESNILYYARQKSKKLQQKKRRLITTGLNGLIIEWDLLNCKPLQKCSVHGGPVWQSKVLGKFAVMGCEDGSIKIAKVKKNKIEVVKSFVKRDTPCLSVEIVPLGKQKAKKAYNSDDDIDEDEEMDHGISFVYAGYANGSIKKWDTVTGRAGQLSAAHRAFSRDIEK